MSAREHILDRLRVAPGRAALMQPDVATYFAKYGRREDEAARLSRFKLAIEAAHAEVFLTGNDAWPALLQRIAREKGLRNLLVGDDLPHVEQLRASIGDAPALVRYQQSDETWRNELFNGIDASLTLARAAIAETGSLILWPDAKEPRLMSLVPPVHIVLLDPARIYADLHSAMIGENWSAGFPTNALLVSGPSKTADIQQVLAYGAHGPKEVIVLVCPSLGRGA